MPSHHTLTSLYHKTSKPVNHTCDSQTGATNTPGLLQFWGLVRFITATLSSVQIRNSGIVNLKNMSVLVILMKILVFLCGVSWHGCVVCREGKWIWWRRMNPWVMGLSIRSNHKYRLLYITRRNWGGEMCSWLVLMGMGSQIVLRWIWFRVVQNEY